MPDLNGPSPAINNTSSYQHGDGNINEVVCGVMAAPTAYTTTATITAAELATGFLSYTGAGHTLTLPTVALWETAYPNTAKLNASFDFTVLATTGDATLAVGTGWTLVGGGDGITSATQATLWRARRTGTGAWSVYRVAG